nr:hypothetical protein CFP56_03954 [Quercus suber]
MDDQPQLQSPSILGNSSAQYNAPGGSLRSDGDHFQYGTGLRFGKRLSHKHHPKQMPRTHADNPSSYGLSHVGNNRSPDQSCDEDVPPQPDVRKKHVPAPNNTMSPVSRISILGLPPTPPTTIDSGAPELQVADLTSDLNFADPVRDALGSQSSTHRTSSFGAHTIPHTPDASPPSTYPAKERIVHLPQYRPIVRNTSPDLRQTRYTSAHDGLSASHIHETQSAIPIVVPLAENVQDTEPEDARRYFDRAYRRDDTGIGKGDGKRMKSPISNLSHQNLIDDDTSEVDSSSGPGQYQLGDSSSTACSETPSVRRSINFSVVSNAALGEKVSIPTELNYPPHQPRHHSDDRFRARSTPAYRGLRLPLPTEKYVSAEDVNNFVYQHIQQANVQKHGIPEKAADIPLKITSMHGEKHHTLKRTTKCLSLRENASDGSPPSSLHDDPPRPRDSKRGLQSSPVVEKDGFLPKTMAARYVSAPLPASTPWCMDAPINMGNLALVQPLDQSDERQHMLRRSRKIYGFQQAPYITPVTMIDNIGQPSWLSSPYCSNTNTTVKRTLRRFSHEHKLENLRQCRQAIEDLHSPRRQDFDMHRVHASPTPISQFSDRTEAEVLEARGVSIFPHNNESLLVIENGSGPSTKDTTRSRQDRRFSDSSAFDGVPSGANSHVRPDSPLTRPRRAPEPPILAVIPPTPNDEVDRQLNVSDDKDDQALIQPQPQPSLFQRARRYSEGVVQPLLSRSYSIRKHVQPRPSTAGDERPVNLSPFWKPRYFWEDVESDDEYDEYGDYDDEDYHESLQRTLPRGGDTSNVEAETRRVFPRNMSVRMPGFRGRGGFLVGNSLGLDRHGTNNRRHYVARRRASEEVLRQVSKDWKFALPSLGEKRAHHFGLTRLKRRFIDQRLRKQDREHERRRQILKDQIQH